ncbi:MFS transporter [Phycicoccus endophyticus]|uniref:MFS transporter n=1 Tax=Phycicoccus endophyticus TaxID=1690220 RepID=A0A7G9R269_9MICO|nr:MFS transporter [Phycicoccus endophyticus]NHI19653.1 MFS transporter [Phycicoccus endophyticus]QNN49694.1 MFS transporter [Phycicoccus endophyticus]GGL34185.1 MFS transporter [Phycicoccus endophyticus]
MSPTFTSLEVRNYRLWFLGGFVSNVGTWMGRVGQDWLVLTVLTAGSATALGIVTGLQFLPFLLLAPWSGLIADRFPRRRILLLTQTMLALTSLVLGVLAVTGTARLWHVYTIALVQGVTTAIDNPARQVIVSEMVPPEKLANAVALNSASFNAGRLIGPGLAGLVIAWWGTGEALLLNTLTFVFVLGALAMLSVSELRSPARATGRGGIREGFAYVRHRRDIQLVMLLVFVLGTFGLNFQITTALVATQVFDKGAGEYGLLGSVMAVGSLSAALLSARRRRPRLRVLLLALVGFTLAAAAAAVAPSYWTFAVALVPVGLAALTALTTANAMVQTRVAPEMRGRVMALYMAIFMGGTPAGAPMIGWVSEQLGPRWTIGVGALAVGLSLVVVSVWLAHAENVRVSYESQRRPRVDVSTAPLPREREDARVPVPEAAR